MHAPRPGDTCAAPTPRRRAAALQLLKRLGLAVLALPVAMVLTFAAFPFWSWLERTTGIESMGREGPASWCYLATWGLLALALAGPALLRAVRSLRPARGHRAGH
ncbi:MULTISPECIES: hypothetical protein [unclassified Acidovorax]|uniref:hypothetical protein n=1 Tax=unclassified Acidovorax TaxID=2684926 RepID=UPI001C4463FF|nr:MULTISPECIES: hypothetical protein [unclassified Acidovorax]MBV7426615.1 hypothetical protein [Acidovorax sp. sif0732]MBV7447740.1 hypothetical protein [Acidovorax sp. sif0715]